MMKALLVIYLWAGAGTPPPDVMGPSPVCSEAGCSVLLNIPMQDEDACKAAVAGGGMRRDKNLPLNVIGAVCLPAA